MYKRIIISITIINIQKEDRSKWDMKNFLHRLTNVKQEFPQPLQVEG